MKSEIRNKMKSLRASLSLDEVRAKSLSASEIFLDSDLYRDAHSIMLYMPIRNEVDTRYIIERAISDGKRVILPSTDRDTGVITPLVLPSPVGEGGRRSLTDEASLLMGAKFSLGAFSIPEPQDADVFDASEIDLVIVPGVAFDRHGTRLGFGRGCYDGFLPRTRAVKVGLCYDFQLADSLPADTHDVSVDYILTEKDLFRVKGTQNGTTFEESI